MLTMVVSLIPYTPITVSAAAGDLDFYSAADAGLDVFTAWFNTANHMINDMSSLDAYISANTNRSKTPFAILMNTVYTKSVYNQAP